MATLHLNFYEKNDFTLAFLHIISNIWYLKKSILKIVPIKAEINNIKKVRLKKNSNFFKKNISLENKYAEITKTKMTKIE